MNTTCDPDQGCAGECGPGDVRCNPDNGDAEACKAGQWTLVEACASQTQLCVVENSEPECITNSFRQLPAQPLTNAAPSPATPNFLRVYRFPGTDVTAQVSDMGLSGDGLPGYAQMVLYEDNGNDYPGARIATTAQIEVEAPGPNWKVIAPSGGILIQPDKSYWIGVVFASEGSPQLSCRTNLQAAQNYEIALSYNAAFPNPFPANVLPSFDRECNLFLRVRTQTP